MAQIVATSARRTALTCAGVGFGAGCMGTWFEMSHGVVCIPVLSLPPLALTQQVAIGSTVFGVAARQVLSASLYVTRPVSDDLRDQGKETGPSLEDLVDTSTAGVLAAFGTATALGGASVAARLSQKHLKRVNGIFCMALSLFMYWRDSRVREAREAAEAGMKAKGLENVAAEAAAGRAVGPPGVEGPRSMGAPTPVQVESPTTTSLGMPEVSRLAALGMACGGCLGLFGIGPAWILAPVLTYAGLGCESSGGNSLQDIGPSLFVDGVIGIGAAASDEKTIRTATLAMVPPSLAAAARHMTLGHVGSPGFVAFPLAAGAIAGSLVAGNQLEDVPCDEEFRYGLSVCLFAYGCWSWFLPAIRGY